MCFTAMAIFVCNVLNLNSLECASISHQEYQIRTKAIDIKNNEPPFYHYSIKINKCCGNCNSINDPYAKLCVPDVVKNINLKYLI